MSFTRYHLTENGPKDCTATVRTCPIGGAHFETKEAAEAAYEFKAERKFSPFSVLKKKVDPHLKHISNANERIKKLSRELDARSERQRSETLFHQLIAEGFSREEIEARFNERVEVRHSGVSYVDNGEGEKVLGISYRADHRSEEERGLNALVDGLAAGEYRPQDIRVHERGELTILAVRTDLRKLEPTIRTMNQSEELALERYGTTKSPAEWDRYNQLDDEEYEELKARYEDKLSEIPEDKDDLIEEIIAYENPNGFRPQAVGEFSNGDALVLATKDPLEASLYRKLGAASEAGTIAVGTGARGSLTFYDERDMSRTAKEKEIRREEAEKTALAYVSDAQAKLQKMGNLSSIQPRVEHDIQDIRNAKFFVNYSPAGHRQIVGVYTKEELEAFADQDFSAFREN